MWSCRMPAITMSIPSLLHSRCTTSLSSSLTKPHLASAFALVSRKYATHRDPGSSSLLSQTLDQKQRALPRRDSVGPFQLGLAQPVLGHGEKKWSELSTGGKVLRTTERTTNLTVILFGAGLSAVLIYCLTSELFSKNSPTVLYGDACERIKASHRVSKYLNGPLTFHNTAPSAIRPRHRNRHVSSRIIVDSSGREHMILNFYVSGRPPGSTVQVSEASYFDSLIKWTSDKASVLSDLTLDESIFWMKECAAIAKERAKRAFKYLSGAPVPLPTIQPTISPNSKETDKNDEGHTWSFAGMFSSLKGPRGGVMESHSEPDGRVWTDGEVHADLIRNNAGDFVFRYLLIDMPNSRSRNPLRLFVERTSGVKDNEPVMRWDL